MITIKKPALSRRTLLRGAVGGSAISMGLPVLEAMCNSHGSALANGTAFPTWFGVFWWGNGVRLSQWIPKGTGVGDAWTLSPALAPFAPVKSHLHVVTGTRLEEIGNEIEHSQGICNFMAGGERRGPQGPTATQPGPTIDQLVARVIGTSTPIKSLEVGVAKYRGGDQGTPNRFLSHNGPNNYNPPEYSPQKVFTRLFGGPAAPMSAAEPGSSTPPPINTVGLRQSVLDAVKADAARLRSRLGSKDLRILEQHLEGVSALEKRVALLEATGGRIEPGPSMGAAVNCGNANAPSEPGPLDFAGISQAMNRLLAMALACGQTRVFTNHFCGPRDDNIWVQAGASGAFHNTTHNEGGDQPNIQKIIAFIMKQFADLLIVFKETQVGTGNLLDHGAVFGVTDCAEGRGHSGIVGYPLVLGGKAGGGLRGDVHFNSTEKATNVLQTALTALKLDVSFGISARCKPTRAITELMT